ncbi:MAG: hypothetical protein SEPTF4163_005469, partial [Sporothrix epigloea]
MSSRVTRSQAAANDSDDGSPGPSSPAPFSQPFPTAEPDADVAAAIAALTTTLAAFTTSFNDLVATLSSHKSSQAAALNRQAKSMDSQTSAIHSPSEDNGKGPADPVPTVEPIPTVDTAPPVDPVIAETPFSTDSGASRTNNLVDDGSRIPPLPAKSTSETSRL